MVNPPREGQPSYELYVRERNAINASLRRKAHMLEEGMYPLVFVYGDSSRLIC